ncbi:GNAT family N-acetyltransferase [Ornithinibacillus halotolerans]|uniref:Acetyltransferase n=1 Tax=Ornithinibacillus halotolerans TaxID=1274357 RepID=A0A916RXP6_9BACI|nr:GNAT family N-acetyltransferase [Ornithinibacillus halotolerans]GGA75363.1 acetyltransferase [Ornithinibacillus halotolerans]
MKYKRCSEVDRSSIHEAFLYGYSDYAIPMNITMGQFFERFFGQEGNTFQDSFIAFDIDEPVGLVLGGVRTYGGYKNLRCGTLCVKPEYRGEGVSQELFRLFVDNGISQKCERLSLEVLSENKRAIRFYEKQGYKKNHKLIYFSQALDANRLKLDRLNRKLEIEEVDLFVAAEVRKNILPTHINWQNEVEYFMKDHTAHRFAAYVGESIVGTLVITYSGKIYFLFVNEEVRRKAIASSLLSHSIKQLNLQKLKISMPDNIDIAEFLRKIGFKKDTIEQYEMYKLV